MANSLRTAAISGFLVVAVGAAGAAQAASEVLREPPSAAERVLVSFSEHLRLKLARTAPVDDSAWANLVNETAFMARRLGIAGDAVISAHRRDGGFVAVVQGRGVVAGRDPDRVLGRLLYVLAEDDRRAAFAAPVAITDQHLTGTLAALISALR